MTEWQLRYRSPLSPTKGVDDVIIGTDSAHETAAGSPDAAAKELALHWLETHVASPSTRFVFVRRCVVATSADMRKEKGIEEPKVAPAPKPAAQTAQTPKAATTPPAGDPPETTGTGGDDKKEPTTPAPATTGGRGRVGA